MKTVVIVAVSALLVALLMCSIVFRSPKPESPAVAKPTTHFGTTVVESQQKDAQTTFPMTFTLQVRGVVK